MNISITFSSALIKLRKRHVLEWDTLAINQQKVWQLVCEENAPKPTSTNGNKWSAVDLIRKQTVRITEISANQREVRAQLKARHQQEKTLLEQAFRTPQYDSSDLWCLLFSRFLNGLSSSECIQ